MTENVQSSLPNVATYSIGRNANRPDRYIAKYIGRPITSPICADRQVTILCNGALQADVCAQQIAAENGWGLLSVREE